MLQMANIREQDSWVHSDRIEATRKAKALLTGAINRVNHHQQLSKREVPVNPASMVLGGGIAGITAALELADSGNKVFLVEKEALLGGLVKDLDVTYPDFLSVTDAINYLIKRVEVHPDIKVYKKSTLTELHGYIGNFTAMISRAGKSKKKLEFGNLVIAIGLQPVNGSVLSKYGYGFFKEVITAIEFEALQKRGLMVNPFNVAPRNVAIVQLCRK